MLLRHIERHIENLRKYCGATECSFDVNTTYTRTPTFDWFNEYNEHGNHELKIIDSKLGFHIEHPIHEPTGLVGSLFSLLCYL